MKREAEKRSSSILVAGNAQEEEKGRILISGKDRVGKFRGWEENGGPRRGPEKKISQPLMWVTKIHETVMGEEEVNET